MNTNMNSRYINIEFDEDLVRKNTNNNENLFKLARRIYDGLQEHGYTANSFDKKHGVSKTSILEYIRGNQVPSVLQLLKFAECFNVSTDYLLGLTDLKSPNNDFKTVHNLTGLTDDAIQGLQMYYDMVKNRGFNVEKCSIAKDFRTINYLLSDNNGFKLFNSLTDYLWFKEIYKNGINGETKIIDDDTNFEYLFKEHEEMQKIRIDRAIYALKDKIDKSLNIDK